MSPNCKIKIIRDGPYVVTGNVPLTESIITPKGNEYEMKAGREFPQAGVYRLCRCGETKNPPFCDGTHAKINFEGTETASKETYENRAEFIEGAGLDLLDDNRCAFARLCHSDLGITWDLMENTDKVEYRIKAVKTASECPAGRLTAVGKDGKAIEPEYKPSVEILQDPETGVSAGIFVKGNILIESADGKLYEVRNRAVLCRCGKSRNKPFCDAAHIVIQYSDMRYF